LLDRVERLLCRVRELDVEPLPLEHASDHEAGQLGVVHDKCFQAWHDDLFLYG
jgi:hypothetical protein